MKAVASAVLRKSIISMISHSEHALENCVNGCITFSNDFCSRPFEYCIQCIHIPTLISAEMKKKHTTNFDLNVFLSLSICFR